MSEAIKLTNLSFSYDGIIDLFTDLTFSVKKGSLNILMGSNGSGKSTFLKLCSGLLKPTSGKIEIEGINSSNQKKIFDLVTFSFQAPHHQFIHSNVQDELESWGKSNNETGLESLSKKYSLERFYSRSPFTLSEGEKKQLAFHKKVREGFLKLAKENSRKYKVIKSYGTISQVQDEIRKAIKKLI